MKSKINRVCFDMLACQTAGSRHRGIGNYSSGLTHAIASLAPDFKTFLIGKRDLESVLEISKVFAGIMPANRLKTIRLPALPSFELPRNSPAAAMQAAVLARAYSRVSPDIVHISSLFEIDVTFPHPAYCPGQIKSTTLYDLIPFVFSERYLSSPQVSRWYHSKLAQLQDYDLIFSISEASKRDAINLIGINQENIITILGACAPAFTPFRYTPEEACELREKLGIPKPFLMFTGGIDWRKNIEGAILAYAQLPVSTRRDYCFAIVCRILPEEKRRLQSLVNRAGLQGDEVIFTGFVSELDLVALYRTCRAFIFPSFYEGFGLPPLEAISCGAPTIIARNSSLTEIVLRPDAWFDAANRDDMAAKMNAVLADDHFRHSLIQTGLLRAKEFTWERSAKIVLNAWQDRIEARTRSQRTVVAFSKSHARPRLAYVSPLPPQRSGIADFSSELIRILASHYEIDLFTTAQAVDDQWITSSHSVHPITELNHLGAKFDIILYQIGNSEFHAPMLDLMKRWPGIIELHDFYVSNMLNWMGTNILKSALLSTHGPEALSEPITGETVGTITNRYAANRFLFEHAIGVIVHSNYAAGLIERDFPEGIPAPVEVIPLLRHSIGRKICPKSRTDARKKLGLFNDELVVCSFGHVSSSKCPEILLSAFEVFASSNTALRTRLVFVGNAGDDASNRILLNRIACSHYVDKITITNYVSKETYLDWINSCDISVQLRRDSRGETSAAVLDCMSHGLPVVMNRYAEFRDYPDNVAMFTPEIAQVSSVADALTALASSPKIRENLGDAAHDHVLLHHSPNHLSSFYFDTIQRFTSESWGRNPRRFIEAVEQAGADTDTLQPWLQELIGSEVVLRPMRIYLDVSSVEPDARQWARESYKRLRSEGREVWSVHYQSDTLYPFACHPSTYAATDFIRTDVPIHLQYGDVALFQLPPDNYNSKIIENLRHAGVMIDSTGTLATDIASKNI